MSISPPISWDSYGQYDATDLAKLVTDGEVSAARAGDPGSHGCGHD